MLALKNWLLSTSMLFLVLFLICLNKWYQINWALSNEYDFTIFNFTICIWLDNATLTEIQRLEVIVASNRNISFTLRLEGNNCFVIETYREIYMIGVTSVRQFCCFLKCLMPRFLLNGAVRLIVTTYSL